MTTIRTGIRIIRSGMQPPESFQYTSSGTACVMLSIDAMLRNMLRNLSLILTLFTTAGFAQTPTKPETPVAAQRPAMAETPNTDGNYALAPDALVQDGVPKGEIRGPFTLPSQVYPGTQHTYWIYVPSQYAAATPASL